MYSRHLLVLWGTSLPLWLLPLSGVISRRQQINYAVVESCGVEVTLLYEDNESKLGGMCEGGQQRHGI